MARWRLLIERVAKWMVAGHLRIQGGYYQVILSYKDGSGKRKTISISTGLEAKGKFLWPAAQWGSWAEMGLHWLWCQHNHHPACCNTSYCKRQVYHGGKGQSKKQVKSAYPAHPSWLCDPTLQPDIGKERVPQDTLPRSPAQLRFPAFLPWGKPEGNPGMARTQQYFNYCKHLYTYGF